MPIATINPATGALIREFEPHTQAELDAALSRAAEAAGRWRRRPTVERASVLTALATRLDAERESLAALATLEMGKTIRSARDEVAKCAFAARHYGTRGPAMLAAEHIRDGDFAATVRYDAVGVVLAVMPWNFPYWQVIRAAVPALLAGNAMVLKHASNVPQCALALERLFAEAGAPAGLFQTLLVPSSQVAGLIADPRVAAITLTGSDAAGRAVAEAAGRATKKCVLELGGSDPFIVLHDADLRRAAEVGVTSRMLNNGQSCICAKRFIVDARVADEFESLFAARVNALVIGDPADEATDVGPLATEQGVADLTAQVERTLRAGATVVTGGHTKEPPAASVAGTMARGWYFPPTMLRDVPPDSAAATEELFGPVAPMLRVGDIDEAISLANGTRYGLGASVWTRDRDAAERCVAELEAGLVFINAMVASDPRVPFGGVKASGYGREVGLHGLREFVNVKTVRGDAGN